MLLLFSHSCVFEGSCSWTLRTSESVWDRRDFYTNNMSHVPKTKTASNSRQTPDLNLFCQGFSIDLWPLHPPNKYNQNTDVNIKIAEKSEEHFTWQQVNHTLHTKKYLNKQYEHISECIIIIIIIINSYCVCEDEVVEEKNQRVLQAERGESIWAAFASRAAVRTLTWWDDLPPRWQPGQVSDDSSDKTLYDLGFIICVY